MKTRRYTKRHESINPKNLRRIIDHISRGGPYDLRQTRDYAVVLTLIATGARNKELRLANRDDLDTDQWTLVIRHPKGEDSYADIRTVPVLPFARPVLSAYLSMEGSGSEALFPVNSAADGGHMSSNSLRGIVSEVSSRCGVDFNCRDCRRTFGQLLIDAGASIEDVSVLMSHRTTKTTETYYARRKNSAALAAVNSILVSNPSDLSMRSEDAGYDNWCNHRDSNPSSKLGRLES